MYLTLDNDKNKVIGLCGYSVNAILEHAVSTCIKVFHNSLPGHVTGLSQLLLTATYTCLFSMVRICALRFRMLTQRGSEWACPFCTWPWWPDPPRASKKQRSAQLLEGPVPAPGAHRPPRGAEPSPGCPAGEVGSCSFQWVEPLSVLPRPEPAHSAHPGRRGARAGGVGVGPSLATPSP